MLNVTTTSCEVTGRPCCVGKQGVCTIASREHCDYVNGEYHEDKRLCSEVSSCFILWLQITTLVLLLNLSGHDGETALQSSDIVSHAAWMVNLVLDCRCADLELRWRCLCNTAEYCGLECENILSIVQLQGSNIASLSWSLSSVKDAAVLKYFVMNRICLFLIFLFASLTRHYCVPLGAQVNCLSSICGLTTFANTDTPDQFYRLWTSLCIHVGYVLVATSL